MLIGSGWTAAADGLRIWHDQDDGGVAMILASEGLDRLGIEHTLSMAVPRSGARATGVEIHIAPDQYDRLAQWFPSIGHFIDDTAVRCRNH